MKYVNVKKSALLETVKKNKEDHIKEYDELCTAFKENVENWAKKLIKLCKGEVKDIQTYCDLPRPSCHVKQYDKAISMLEMSVDENISLTSEEFQSLVHNEWDWSNQFNNTKSVYNVGLK